MRDPRGTMASRLDGVRNWCIGHSDCDDPKRLCNELEDQYYISKHFRKKYRSNFMYVLHIKYSKKSKNIYTNNI